MNLQEMRNYIYREYQTIHGKPIHALPDDQVIAIYHRLINRKAKKQPVEQQLTFAFSN